MDTHFARDQRCDDLNKINACLSNVRLNMSISFKLYFRCKYELHVFNL